MDVTIAQEDPAEPDVLALLHNGHANSARLYSSKRGHSLSIDALRAPEVRLLVARDLNGRALGTGAVVLNGDWAEIKRMWVEEDARGRGLAKKLLKELTQIAQEGGASVLRLEAGVLGYAALALYKTAGFRQRQPFGSHSANPLSSFWEKHLP